MLRPRLTQGGAHINQPRGEALPPGIEPFGTIGGAAGQRGDAAILDQQRAKAIKPRGGVDQPSIVDEQWRGNHGQQGVMTAAY